MADDHNGPPETSAVQKYARLAGIVFLLVGILGFIPGPVQNFEDFKFAGHSSDAELFGIFQVSALHNIVHLLFGVAGLALSRTPKSARTFLLGGGVVYLVLFVYGLVTSQRSGANFVPMNKEDDVLHLVLGAALLAGGLLLGRRHAEERTPVVARGPGAT